MTLLDLLPPFTEGQPVRWAPTARPGFTQGRPYTVTAVVDEGDRWRVDAWQGKPHQGPGIVTRWAKGQTPRIEAVA